MARVDPITTQVIRYAMEQIADEMGWTMVRTARSTVIKEIMDISCAVFDAQGRTVAQAHHAPMLLTGFEITMREVVKLFPPEKLQDGDIIISNDPYRGGQHVMDLQTFAPVFHGGEVVGWVATIAHHSDLGGAVPGGVAGGLTEVYAEGLRLPMVKLYRQFQESEEIFRILETNIRVPDKTLGDVRAQASSLFVGAQRLKEVFDKYGRQTVTDAQADLLDYSEQRLRKALSEMPDGDFTGEDFIDNDGLSEDIVRIQVTVKKRGDSVTVDFTGTSPQRRGNINCPLATTHAAVYYAIIAVADPDLAPNHGAYRPIAVHAPEGLIVNPKSPGAVAARTNCSQKVAEAVLRAMAPVLPERVCAGSHGQITNCGFSGVYPETGKRWVFTDIQGGGAGGRPGKDGKDGQDSHLARFMNTPVEAAEIEYPILTHCYEFIADTGGAGKYRGALGMRKDTEFLVDDVSWARYSDRHVVAAPGLWGGKEGSLAKFYLNPGTPAERVAQSKGHDYLRLGEIVSIRLPGGGGWGKPAERDPALVLRDVRDGKVTVEAARTEYKVVIDTAAWAVDEQATAALRSEA